MQIRNIYTSIVTLITFLFFATSTSYAQQATSPAGGAGNDHLKYDKTFVGVGPTVYELPAPRTKAELLAESYRDKLYFQDSIAKALDLQQLVQELKPVSNASAVPYLLHPQPDGPTNWEALVKQEAALENYAGVYALLYSQADLLVKAGHTKQAVAVLKEALRYAQKTTNLEDIAAIQGNLANVYIYEKNIPEAKLYQEAYYKETLRQKNNVEQAAALITMALIDAHAGDYRVAEDKIIRKAVPMFNKAKAYERKVFAWQVLARVYQYQDKHTEAQWFLIQARDLAVKYKLNDDLAEIEYMLAFSKFAQQNFKVAQLEFIKADKLAVTEDNKLLRLAIADKLGQIYMTDNDLKEAERALKSYEALRSELFRQ